MPASKNALLRYLIIDRHLQTRNVEGYSVIELLEKCNQELSQNGGNESHVEKRTIQKDLEFLMRSDGYNAPISVKRYGRTIKYKYEEPDFSIRNAPLRPEEMEHIQETIILLSRISGIPEFQNMEEIMIRLDLNLTNKQNQDLIQFDDNPYLKGLRLLPVLFQATTKKTPLEITYKPFGKDENSFGFHPWLLKQYNKRWFVLGWNEKEALISTLAIDRIVSIDKSDSTFIENDKLIPEDYFEDIIGVTRVKDEAPVIITLRILKKQWHYIKTKPIHGSQKILKKDDEAVYITLELIPNIELENTILSFGEYVTIIKPESFRNKMYERIRALHNSYADKTRTEYDID